MKKYFKNSIIVICVSLLLLTLCSTKCRRGPCHHSIKIVNNSETTISIRRLTSHDGPNGMEYWLYEKSGSSISPYNMAEVDVEKRYCMEDYTCHFVYYVLPDSFPCITTTLDSLYIVYDILKTFDINGDISLDSLEKTDYTVYYP